MLTGRSPEARKAMEKFTLLQLGMAKRGAEAYCHSLCALWENGFAILKTDFRNGFNEISRQAVLDAVQTRCPELTSRFNLFYTCESSFLFSVGDATNVGWSREGVRMGCPLGSFGFDLALQGVLEQASQRNGLHVVRAITDDAAIAVRLPDDHQAAVEALRALRSNFDDMRTDARDQLGLSLNARFYFPEATPYSKLTSRCSPTSLSARHGRSLQPFRRWCSDANTLRSFASPVHVRRACMSV